MIFSLSDLSQIFFFIYCKWQHFCFVNSTETMSVFNSDFFHVIPCSGRCCSLVYYSLIIHVFKESFILYFQGIPPSQTSFCFNILNKIPFIEVIDKYFSNQGEVLLLKILILVLNQIRNIVKYCKYL
jgi:hypothetical protein